jgi:hypothetical protein
MRATGTGRSLTLVLLALMSSCSGASALYSVGVTVSGLAGSGLVLRDNGGDDLAVSGDGSFVFSTALPGGSAYDVTVFTQPTSPAQQCAAASGSGTIADASVSVRVTCGSSACAPLEGAGTTHGSITAAETWTEAASPHVLPYDTSISAAVTLEPCAVVRIAADKTVTINPGGAFIAAGEVGRPVTIEAQVPGAAWSSIRAVGGALSLTHAIVSGGGAPLNTLPAYAGALHMQSSGPAGTLHVDDVEIADSRSQGVFVNGEVGFDATSQGLRVHGSAGFPLHVWARVLGSIPAGDYTGNGRDAIGISGSGGPVLDAQTMHDRGVPYHVGSGQDGTRMDVYSQAAGTVAVLTIEPGVTIQFPPGGTLNVDASGGADVPARGALVAIGTVARPIVFTSDRGVAAAAGDWLGVGFGGEVDARSVLQHVRVEFAGGSTITGSNSCPYPGRVGPNYAAIRIFGPPLSQFITDTDVISSARDGIDRGWRSDLQPDFLATNSFTALPGCKESMPATQTNACPASPACP